MNEGGWMNTHLLGGRMGDAKGLTHVSSLIWTFKPRSSLDNCMQQLKYHSYDLRGENSIPLSRPQHQGRRWRNRSILVWPNNNVWGFGMAHICTNACNSLPYFSIIDILVDTKWCFPVIFICISLMANAEWLFTCLLTPCISSLEKDLFNFFAQSFSIWVACLCCLCCWAIGALYIFWILDNHNFLLFVPFFLF